MRHGDFAALSGIALGATTAAVLTVALVQALSMKPNAFESPGTERELTVIVAPPALPEVQGAFGFRPPIDFAVIRHPGGRMSGPESAATGWHRPSGVGPHVPDSR